MGKRKHFVNSITIINIFINEPLIGRGRNILFLANNPTQCGNEGRPWWIFVRLLGTKAQFRAILFESWLTCCNGRNNSMAKFWHRIRWNFDRTFSFACVICVCRQLTQRSWEGVNEVGEWQNLGIWGRESIITRHGVFAHIIARKCACLV